MARKTGKSTGDTSRSAPAGAGQGWARETPGAVVLRLRIQPGASRDAVAGEREGRLCLRVQAPPVEGAANEAVRRFLAARLDVSKARTRLTRGERSREKEFTIDGVALEHVVERLRR